MNTIPTYRFHTARNAAVVTINGRDHYLGIHNSPVSLERYHRLIAEHHGQKQLPDPPNPDETPLSVSELIVRYWRHATSYYVKNGQPTTEQAIIRCALRHLRKHYGSIPAKDLSPKKLKALRETLIKQVPEPGDRHIVQQLSRSCINKYIDRIKRLYSWGVEEELVPGECYQSLRAVQGLRRGRTEARETKSVRGVDATIVEATLPFLPSVIVAMVRIQLMTGARPQEVVMMRACEITQETNVWEYHPTSYKTEHHNDGHSDHDRVLYLGPSCQQLLRPYLDQHGIGFLFAPAITRGAPSIHYSVASYTCCGRD